MTDLPVGRPAPRPAPSRWLAIAALLVGVAAVAVVVFALRRDHPDWITVGPEGAAESVPGEAAIGVFAIRTTEGRLAVAGLARGSRRRCLQIQFEVVGEPGRSPTVHDDDCPSEAIAGRGIRVPGDQAVRVSASGKALVTIHSRDLDTCTAGLNLCAMVFDRHGARLRVGRREGRGGEVDRDDLLRASLERGGRNLEVEEGSRDAIMMPEQYGAVAAEAWTTALDAEAGRGGDRAGDGDEPADITTAEAIGALLTRRPEGFTVLVDYDGSAYAADAKR